MTDLRTPGFLCNLSVYYPNPTRTEANVMNVYGQNVARIYRAGTPPYCTDKYISNFLPDIPTRGCLQGEMRSTDHPPLPPGSEEVQRNRS